MTELESLQAENAALKQDVANLRAELNASEAASRQYLQNVAHQLTAPLGAIKWSIEALEDEKVPLSRKSNLLRSIYSQATILVHLIKNFALMSSLEADHELGQLRDRAERVDLRRLAINLANDFQPQAAEVGKKIVIDDMSFDRMLGSKMALVEKNLIAQSISNLLENAVKYADPNTTISVSAEKVIIGDKAVNAVGLSVTSTGIPLGPAEIGKLVDRGFRGKAAKQRVPAGTGIGLYLANRVMQLHLGTIHIESKGKQSRFTLVFPMARIS
jgi:two-component system sensor histidine kinase VanS